jgi:hypothetical protein
VLARKQLQAQQISSTGLFDYTPADPRDRIASAKNPIVVCDVSGKNPNVMFELGMRLAFDKPTIIVKDETTTYSFDTSAIEHIEYPRDLRFAKIVEFKEKLAQKIKATYEKSTTDQNYTTFLKHFGEFKVAKIEQKEVSGQEYIIDELRSIRSTMRRLERSQYSKDYISRENADSELFEFEFDYCLGDAPEPILNKIVECVTAHPGVIFAGLFNMGVDHKHIRAKLRDREFKDELRLEIRKMLPKNQKNRHEERVKLG